MEILIQDNHMIFIKEEFYLGLAARAGLATCFLILGGGIIGGRIINVFGYGYGFSREH